MKSRLTPSLAPGNDNPRLTRASKKIKAEIEEPKRLLLSEAESHDADCIFVGARGLSRFERLLLGSVSTAVVTRAHCSVEVVRAK